MAEWITDRTQEDVDRVNELHAKATAGTWTEEEQAEWISGMKGALNSKDMNRIAYGMRELANILGVSTSGFPKTDWTQNDYMTQNQAMHLILSVRNIRLKCSGKSDTPFISSGYYLLAGFSLTFATINMIEQILSDIEELAKTYVTFSGEYSCGEGQYGF